MAGEGATNVVWLVGYVPDCHPNAVPDIMDSEWRDGWMDGCDNDKPRGTFSYPRRWSMDASESRFPNLCRADSGLRTDGLNRSSWLRFVQAGKYII